LDASAATFFASLASRGACPRPSRPPRRGEYLRLVHHHQRGIPVLARGVEQRGEEQRDAANLLLHLEFLERQHGRGAVLPHLTRQRFDLAR